MVGKVVTMKNNEIILEISLKGAELQSVTGKNGTQFLWHGDKKFWSDKAPVLFPICGGLKDGKYVFDNKEYYLKQHGYAMHSIFEVESRTDKKVVFLHISSAETLKSFPFDYELRVIYTLEGNTLEVGYEVKNTSSKAMYFSIGAHEGYFCPEGIDQYSVVFEKNETLNHYVTEDGVMTGEIVQISNNSNILNLSYDYYKTIDTLVFKDLNSKSLTLKHKNSNKRVTINFDGFPYLLFWTKQNAPYICIEPWCGIVDNKTTDHDITKKEGIQKLGANETFAVKHTVSFRG